jgi:hypothetical protein
MRVGTSRSRAGGGRYEEQSLSVNVRHAQTNEFGSIASLHDPFSVRETSLLGRWG